MEFWELVTKYWHVITASAVVEVLLLLAVIPWILSLKKETTSAIAWCLLVILIPVFGVLLFVLFGYQSVSRPLKRKKAHRERFRRRSGIVATEETSAKHIVLDSGYEGLGRLAARLGGSMTMTGNRVEFYHDGISAFEAMFEAIRAARHHIHLEFFIFREDRLGTKLLDLLSEKAQAGVQVRILTDGIGARRFRGRGAVAAGCRLEQFLPVSLLRRRIQVNLRNHRKIIVIDGRIAFTGGLNVGDEYVGESTEFGYWRDTFLRLEGPAVEPLQQVFIEDWDFASGESIETPEFFPPPAMMGDVPTQVIASGPDQEHHAIRDIYFAAILRARERLWIMSPYYVPDQSIRDGLTLAALSGRDVRLLVPKKPDHIMPYFAARYYYGDLLEAGVKVFTYTKGFMHSKVIMVDGKWATVGTANLDNRSLLLNFEVNCLFHSPSIVAQLEQAFLIDLDDSIRLNAKLFAKRNIAGKLMENICRLFAPVL